MIFVNMVIYFVLLILGVMQVFLILISFHDSIQI